MTRGSLEADPGCEKSTTTTTTDSVGNSQDGDHENENVAKVIKTLGDLETG